MPLLLLTALALAALSLLAPSEPGYDPWAWLTWGRELAGGELSTTDGPAFKPLAVALATVLAPAGDAAPALWLVVARAGAIAAVLLGGRVAWRASGGSWVAAAVAAVGVALCEGWWWHGAVGNAEGLFVALVLAAIDAGLQGAHRRALALGVAAGLLRPESWPFLLVYGAWLWRRDAGLRPALGAAALALPALWFVPEWLGSGEVLRSSARARIPNPGAPATADHPMWASLQAAARIPLLPLLPLALLARRRALWVAGAAWIALIAVMAERGYSGEPRYALPGAALLAVAAGAGAGRLRPAAVGSRRSRSSCCRSRSSGSTACRASCAAPAMTRRSGARCPRR